MRLDRIIQALLPHDQMFYSYFDQSARHCSEAAALLETLVSAPQKERAAIAEKIHAVENQGDDLAHKIFNELNSTFVTPFDREDIHQLASKLDDVLDFIDGAARRIVLYDIKKCPKQIYAFCEIVHKAVNEIQRGVSMLSDLRRVDDLNSVFLKVNELENDADRVFDDAVAQLFHREKNPIQVIKLKEIFVALETTTDACEDVSNVLESIMIKHA